MVRSGLRSIQHLVCLLAMLTTHGCDGGQVQTNTPGQPDGGALAFPDSGASTASATTEAGAPGDGAASDAVTGKGKGIGVGNNGEACGDGLDNNGNGAIDEGCGCDPVKQPTQPCYTGTAATRNVGLCQDGAQKCEVSGEFTAWGSCVGSVLPAKEDCVDGKDNDCNGKTDDGAGCVCKPGDTKACYSGAATTKGVGLCQAGQQPCNAAGTGWDLCAGEVLPVTEVCHDGLDNDCDGLVDEGCKALHTPVACTQATMTHVSGAKDCKADQAVFMMDDGYGPSFICCPLPATDILGSAPPVVRWGTCAANEVIVGATGQMTFKCQAINTKRYQLGPAKLPCYFGSGASGSQGVSKCPAHPSSFSVLQYGYFGSDGCSAYPYGSLFTRQTSKYCKDMRAVQLQYSGAVPGDPAAGTPVVMYKP